MGETHMNWHHLHEKYGEVVRINPNTLSIIKPDAWRGRQFMKYAIPFD